jgi:hypothetical protein
MLKMKLIKYILLLLFFTSCSIGLFTTSKERKIERAKSKIQKLVKKYPELVEYNTDTVEIQKITIDTVFTKEIDTTFVNQISSDTVTVETERIVIKYRVINDSLHMNFKVKQDTIPIHDTIYVKVPVKQAIINAESDCKAYIEKNLSYGFWFIVVIFAIIVIVKLLYKFIKPL